MERSQNDFQNQTLKVFAVNSKNSSQRKYFKKLTRKVYKNPAKRKTQLNSHNYNK